MKFLKKDLKKKIELGYISLMMMISNLCLG